MKLTHGSLFTGFGGFDLAAARCDISTVWQCENNKFCLKFLNHFFPEIPKIKDINIFDYEKTERTNIISGGFPCQDISNSGKGAGIFGDKSSAVFKMLEIIEVMRPDFAIFENSPVLNTRGLDIILRMLAVIGYDAQWRTICASDFGYKHKRRRLFILAYPNESGQKGRIFRPVETLPIHVYKPTKTYLQATNKSVLAVGDYYDICGVHGIPRNFRKVIGGFGNAVNVTCAEYVFRCIIEFIKSNNHEYNRNNNPKAGYPVLKTVE